MINGLTLLSRGGRGQGDKAGGFSLGRHDSQGKQCARVRRGAASPPAARPCVDNVWVHNYTHHYLRRGPGRAPADCHGTYLIERIEATTISDLRCTQGPELPATLVGQHPRVRVSFHGGDAPRLAGPRYDGLSLAGGRRGILWLGPTALAGTDRRGAGRFPRPQTAIQNRAVGEPGDGAGTGGGACRRPGAGLARVPRHARFRIGLCAGNAFPPHTHPRHRRQVASHERGRSRQPGQERQRSRRPFPGRGPDHMGECHRGLRGRRRFLPRVADIAVEAPCAHPGAQRRTHSGQPGARTQVRERTPHPAGHGVDRLRHEPVCDPVQTDGPGRGQGHPARDPRPDGDTHVRTRVRLVSGLVPGRLGGHYSISRARVHRRVHADYDRSTRLLIVQVVRPLSARRLTESSWLKSRPASATPGSTPCRCR